MKITIALLSLLLFGVGPSLAQPTTNDAFAQNKKLGRGVNILGYDPIWRSRDRARFRAEHFRLLKEAGFNSVRINLQPFRYLSSTNDWALPESWFAVSDWAVKEAGAQQLQVILDLHEYNTLGNDPEGNKPKFLAVWHQLAAHYQAAPDSVLFEVLNEPSHKLTPALWNQYLREGLDMIRKSNPDRAVIVGPAFWNSIDHLQELELPATDQHLIVTIHYYKPMDFTHQGAAWVDRQDKLGVEWPGTPKDIEAIRSDFDKAAAWAREHHRPIFLGEFGAYDKAPMDSRARYTAGVARAAEERGWSWAYWQFDSDFILYDINRNSWVEPLRRALIP
jgi:endoglucanase